VPLATQAAALRARFVIGAIFVRLAGLVNGATCWGDLKLAAVGKLSEDHAIMLSRTPAKLAHSTRLART